jgi:hypothetical protein
MKINHSFQINSLLKMIFPHFLENYFAEVKIKKLKTITNHFLERNDIKTILSTFFFTVSKFYKNLVKWALTEMLCSVAGTTTLDREWLRDGQGV